MSARPVLGITACSRLSGQEMSQAVVNRYFEAAVRHADVAALLVPARPDLMSAAEIAPRLDGVLLTGSPSNVEPNRYGSDEAGDGPFDPGRDEMSLRLIEEMIKLGKPVFGICRGFQEMNVAFGGSLARDLSDEGRPLPHHAPDGVPLAGMFDHYHDIDLVPGGLLARAFERDRLRVNSVHFQGIERLGGGLTVEATAPDGVIEAVSAKVNGAQILGVQWHPEWEAGSDPASQGFFKLMGRALRHEELVPASMEETK